MRREQQTPQVQAGRPFAPRESMSAPALLRRDIRHVRPTRLQETCGRLEYLAGRLGPGAKLPTVQQLRGEIGVSVATLNLALSDLEGRGLIRRKRGVGIFVADAPILSAA